MEDRISESKEEEPENAERLFLALSLKVLEYKYVLVHWSISMFELLQQNT